MNNMKNDNIKIIASYLHLIRASDLIKPLQLDVSIALLETASAILSQYNISTDEVKEMQQIEQKILEEK